MTQKLIPFSAPQGKEVNDYTLGDLITDGFTWKVHGGNVNSGDWQARYLYLCSKEKPKEGDWIITSSGLPFHICEIRHAGIMIDELRDTAVLTGSFKIEFTNDPQCNLHGIPPELLQIFADANGKLDEVEIELKEGPTYMSGGLLASDSGGIGNHETTTYTPVIINNACVLAKKEDSTIGFLPALSAGDIADNVLKRNQPIPNDESDKELEEMQNYASVRRNFATPQERMAFDKGYELHEQQSANIDMAGANHIKQQKENYKWTDSDMIAFADGVMGVVAGVVKHSFDMKVLLEEYRTT